MNQATDIEQVLLSVLFLWHNRWSENRVALVISEEKRSADFCLYFHIKLYCCEPRCHFQWDAMFSPWMRRLSQSKVLQAQTDLKQSSYWLEEKQRPVLRIIKGSIDVVSGHPFRFSNVFSIWNSFTGIKAQLLALRTLSLSSFAAAFTESSLFQLGRRWERQWRRKLIELALLTRRCQDHLLGTIPQSLKQGDERDYLQCPGKKKGKKLFRI